MLATILWQIAAVMGGKDVLQHAEWSRMLGYGTETLPASGARPTRPVRPAKAAGVPFDPRKRD